ncbi:MAG: hypothetical protein ABJF88_06655 [Rhodothermales bacterium]
MASFLPLSASRTLLLLVLLVPFAVGCDSTEEDPPAGTAGTYVGTLAGAQTSGVLEVTIDGSDASGSFALAGGGERSVSGSAHPPLTGSFNAGALQLEGGGYTFTGTLSGGVLSGTWTGPGGTSGSFSALLEGEGTVVAVYCGAYDTANDDGTFNLVRQDASLRGFAVSSVDGDTIDLSGSVSGNTLTIYATAAGPTANVATATLAADGATFTGTVNDPENPGTVSGSRCTP